MDKIAPTELTGVSETALWTLWNRSLNAQDPKHPFTDPLAAELTRRIDYPYRQRFGLPTQVCSMRAQAFDAAVRAHLKSHPAAAVVALAEGLQTSYWRLTRPASQWITVDLDQIIRLREQLLPGEPSVTNLALSALDRSWMNLVPTDPPPIITAEGLFMYFDESTVYDLIRDCARHFPSATLVFDGVPGWLARKGFKTVGGQRDPLTRQRYIAPPLLSELSAKSAASLADRIDGVASSHAVPVPPGRGLQGRALQALYQGRLIPDRWRNSLHVLRFTASPGER
jgi:O-methyltransferase involved in polyketide biosynthesis